MSKLTNLFIPTEENKFKPYLLRKVAIIVYSFILVFVNVAGGFLNIGGVQASSITTENIINLTNQERVAWGLNTLTSNPQLSAAALAKANDMFEKQYWDHFGPNGESPWQFIRGAGYSYVYAGENLAKGFRTAEGIHEAWMASPTHKANIISGNYKEIGVAVVEGVLLGKQTVLVVQMFGNLTAEVHGVAKQPEVETPPSKPEPTPQPPSSEKKVVVNKEMGEIKSIRITSPQEGSVVTDARESVLGNTTNVEGKYTVEVYEEETLLGTTSTDTSNWEFSKNSDWEEGEHNIQAKLENENIYSQAVAFTIDSKAPIIDIKSIVVNRVSDIYEVAFTVIGEWEQVQVVMGSDIKELELSKDVNDIKFELTKEQVKNGVIIILSDEHGNSSELDISEYFIEEESGGRKILPLFNLGIGQTVSLGVVTFILLLLIIQIMVYWKKGKFKDAVGEILTVGVWWLILVVASFSGFAGVIN